MAKRRPQRSPRPTDVYDEELNVQDYSKADLEVAIRVIKMGISDYSNPDTNAGKWSRLVKQEYEARYGKLP